MGTPWKSAACPPSAAPSRLVGAGTFCNVHFGSVYNGFAKLMPIFVGPRAQNEGGNA